MNEFYRWVDFCMSVIEEIVPTCIKDSKSVLALLIKLDQISPGSCFARAEAVSMHEKFSTEYVLEVIRSHITEFLHELPTISPAEAALEGLQIIMKKLTSNSVINSLKQIDGASIGTSCSCHCATIYYGHKERKDTLRKCSNDKLLMKRSIDDDFVIENPNFHAL